MEFCAICGCLLSYEEEIYCDKCDSEATDLLYMMGIEL